MISVSHPLDRVSSFHAVSNIGRQGQALLLHETGLFSRLLLTIAVQDSLENSCHLMTGDIGSQFESIDLRLGNNNSVQRGMKS